MTLPRLNFNGLPPDTENLRQDVRDFLATELESYPPIKRALSWTGFDAEFSRKLGDRGWLGLSLPTEYGGHDAGAFARYVVIEELLAAGAPVAAHWMADRQSGPLILKFGTEKQKQKYIPSICRGERFFCIGMSEPNSGSDLASIKTKAERHGDGWLLNGAKLWTTYAHKSHYMIALVRTAPVSDERHKGMSQLLIDLSLPGITIRPIRDLAGGEHFNEVFFDNVELPSDALIGSEGEGWSQVMAELAYERSGPERFLSSIALIHALIDAIGAEPDATQAKAIGRMIARLNSLRAMSLAVTSQLEAGENPSWAASCVKDLGTSFEQEIAEIAQDIVDIEPRNDSGNELADVMAFLMQMAPSFSLRGGTPEILRGIIARGLGLR